MKGRLGGVNTSSGGGTSPALESGFRADILNRLYIQRTAYRFREAQMSDSRFDGKRIYKFMSASQALYDIRGNYIHKAHSASQPEFEIRGTRIHKAHSTSQALYEIR